MEPPLQRFALVFLLFFASTGAYAADSAVYAVHGIQVDATAENPGAARDKAIAQGARKGLEQLLQNLTLADPSTLPTITDKTAGPLVLDFDVESERSSATRYIASMGFRYKPAGVQALLGQMKTHVAQRAPLLLVVPVYRAASGDLLWQTENPWRDAWKTAPDHAGLVPVVAAAGTPEDAQTFTAHDLDDNAKLIELATRYNANNAVIAIASAISPTGEPGQGLNITLAGGGGPDTSFTSPGAATPAAVLAQGVTTTLATLDTIWRQQALKGTTGAVAFKTDGPAQDDSAIAPAQTDSDKFSGNLFALRSELSMPGQWASLRTQIAQLGLSHIELKSLTRDEVIFTVGVAGDEEKLAHALAEGGILLGAPQAVPADSATIAAMVPSNGPGAGLIYPISATERLQ